MILFNNIKDKRLRTERSESWPVSLRSVRVGLAQNLAAGFRQRTHFLDWGRAFGAHLGWSVMIQESPNNTVSTPSSSYSSYCTERVSVKGQGCWRARIVVYVFCLCRLAQKFILRSSMFVLTEQARTKCVVACGNTLLLSEGTGPPCPIFKAVHILPGRR